MLETSKDVLFIVLALCALWLTVFSCWLLYYCIKILRDASKVIDSVQDRLRGIEEAVHMVKEKIENASSSMRIVVESAAMVVKYVLNRRAKKAENEDADGDPFGMDEEPEQPRAKQPRKKSL